MFYMPGFFWTVELREFLYDFDEHVSHAWIFWTAELREFLYDFDDAQNGLGEAQLLLVKSHAWR
jgi:hypothetical protein